MEPIEIEFLAKDSLTGTMRKAGKQAEELGKTAEQAAKSITERIAEQKVVVKRIEEDLKQLNKQYAKMAPGLAQQQMKAEINACKTCLDEERGALELLDREHKKNTESAQKLTTQLRVLQDALAQMRLRGRENTQEYRQMAEEASKLSDIIGDVRQETKALASDDANWEGMASGLSGLSGAVTAGTGIMAMFVGENENLTKIQTKLQSVMAVTMGMQQVFNTLNRDSAFRVVTLTKVKNFLTAANTRLATSLGISAAAANVLMGTLTLGLSVVITGLIVAWNKWSDAQDEAARKAQEMVKTEDGARETLVKTRFELDAARKSLKNYNGTRDEEQKKVNELNQKYGEAFGYYDSVAKWYDVLTEKSAQYTDMLFKQARMQSYVNQAVEVDKELQAHKATVPGNSDTDLGAWNRFLLAGIPGVFGNEKTRKANREAWQKRIDELEKKREELLAKAHADFESSEKISHEFNLGGHSKPGAGKRSAGHASKTSADDILRLGELELKAREKIEAGHIALLKDQYERERATAEMNFEQEKKRIESEQRQRMQLVTKLRKQGIVITAAQEADIASDAATQKMQAAKIYAAEIDRINQNEINAGIEKSEKEQAELDSLLEKYQDYNARRLKIEQTFTDDVKALNAKRTATNSAEIDAALVEAAKVRDKAMRDVNNREAEELKAESSLLVSLFEETADKSVKEIDRIIEQVRLLLQYMNAEKDANGTALIKDRKGNLTRQITTADIGSMGMTTEQLENLKASPESLKAILEQYEKLRNEVVKKNPFKALAESVRELLWAKEDNGESTEKKIQKLGERAAAVADMTGNIAGRLAAVFEAAGNDGLAQATSDIEDVMSSVSNIGKGFAQGGLVGGIAAAAGEAIGWVGKAFAATARHKAALNKIMQETISQQRSYNLLLMQQSLAYEKGTTILGTDTYSKAANAIGVMEKAMRDLNKAQKGIQKIDIVTGHKKTGLFGWGKGKDTYSSILSVYPQLLTANGRLNVSLAETIISTRRMSDESKAALQYMIDLAKQEEEAWKQATDYLKDIFGETGNAISKALRDAFENGTDAGKAFVQKMSSMLETLSQQMIYSVTIAPMIEQAQKDMLEVMKNSNINKEGKFKKYTDILDKLMGDAMSGQQEYMMLMKRYQEMASTKGFDIFKSAEAASVQHGRSGSFETLTQNQGTKLEGLFTSVQIHSASIDEELEDVSGKMGRALEWLTRIESHVSHCVKLDDIAEVMEDIKRNGIKVK